MKNFWKLIIAIAISELAGMIGALFTAPAIPTWYAELAKPELAPPNWVFAPVWTTLFALMGISLFLVWKKDPSIAPRERKMGMLVFFTQLILNALWSFIFFGLQNPGAAFIELLILWLAILATVILFYRISRPAAWLLVPYILWVSFAGYLNYSIWQLNKGDGAEGDLWKIAVDQKTGVSFRYPENILAKYISLADWPPQLQILAEPFACNEGGEEMERAGKTEKRMVDDRVYCVTEVSGGAAGSIYTQYAYAFPKNGKTAIVTFSLRFVQCANYDDPQKTACENESSAFDIDSTVDRIARSLEL